jgi:hypothetical protein
MGNNMLALSKSSWANDIGTTLYQLLGMTLVRWETQWWPNEVTNQSVGPITDCDRALQCLSVVWSNPLGNNHSMKSMSKFEPLDLHLFNLYLHFQLFLHSVGPITDCDLGYAKYMFRYPHSKGSKVYWDQPLKQSFWATAMTMLYTVCRKSWKWR